MGCSIGRTIKHFKKKSRKYDYFLLQLRCHVKREKHNNNNKSTKGRFHQWEGKATLIIYKMDYHYKENNNRFMSI